jgi:phosphatidylglycerol lysyltransferase
MSDSPGRNKLKDVLARIAPYLGGALFLIALFVLRHTLRKYHYHEIIRHIKDLPSGDVLLALGLTAAGYLVLTGYDAISIYYIRRTLPYRRTAFASYVAYALSHSIGVSTLSGGGVRYRLYSSWGLSATEVAKVVMFNGITFWTGFSFVGAAIFILRPMPVPPGLHLPIPSDFYVGLVCLLAVSSYLFICATRKRPVNIFGLELQVPPFPLCFAQITVSSLDWLIAGSVLFVLLRNDLHLPYVDFIGIFLFSQIAGLASQAPGGLGVFEVVALIMLSPYAPPSAVLGSLLVYRGVYYILPMIAAILMLGTQEALRKKEFLKTAMLSASRAAPVLVPDLSAIAVFVAGAVLLISGAAPARISRMSALSSFLPLPAVEVSHVMAGLTGIALLFLARGLQRRVKNAYSLSVLALASGIVFSLMRSFDLEEAVFLLVVLAGLLPFRRLFYRTEPLKAQPLSMGWLIAAALTVACSAGAGVFIYKHAEYTQTLWFKFGYFANAARFFRTTVGAAAALIFIAARSLIRPPRPKVVLQALTDLPKTFNVACSSEQPISFLALREDVKFLIDEKTESFMAIARGGRSGICLGEPIGPPEARAELAWHFLEYCVRNGMKSLFYDLPPENLQVYLDLGLSLLKVSEDAKAPLADVPRGLEYPGDTGYDFRMLPPGSGTGIAISPSDMLPVKSLPLAVLQRDGEILALAPVWQCASRKELSPIFIRTAPGAKGVVNPLIAGLFEWGRKYGWKWLGLGTAPLPEHRVRDNPALSEALRRLPYTHREHFDSAIALREFKESLRPVWEPRFIAIPPGLSSEEAVLEVDRVTWASNS